MAWSGRVRILRQLSAAAACLIVGVLVGWFGHSRNQSAQPMASDSASRITFPDNGNSATLVSNSPSRNGSGGFNVQITDDTGRVLGVQHFDTLHDAREFSNDLSRWQARQRQMRSGDIRLIGDDF
jgi:hypothetical protein